MNRRQFTTALSALAAVPAMPLKALTAAPAATAAIPNTARFWAIYMSQMHGTCTAATLSTMTGLEASAAQGYLSRMISEGIITPTRMMSKVAKVQANRTQQPSKWRERVQKFMDEKTPEVAEIIEPEPAEVEEPEDQS